MVTKTGVKPGKIDGIQKENCTHMIAPNFG